MTPQTDFVAADKDLIYRRHNLLCPTIIPKHQDSPGQGLTSKMEGLLPVPGSLAPTPSCGPSPLLIDKLY
ncbi:hypothetical protein AMECASPLE_006305 [Ameca splendens]|uniref:Uncharacterized protein n=1 Tax=Ameca splendens TaxID=208324 RepID=A0ABV0ZW02_9TELE